jgi:O-acetylhomoserine (thiol)-lyase
MTEGKRFGFDTRMVHAGHIPDAQTGARAVPIYQTTSYVFNSADEAAQLFDLKRYGHIYSRISNPTVAVFEERMASLEGATGAVATSSGMSAQLAVFMTLLAPGDEILASSHLYGGSVTQLSHTLKKLSITVQYASPENIDAWESLITPRTKALYGETIGNPRGSILDIERLASLGDKHKIPLIVDNTMATPYLCRPMEHGASIVVYSATKFIGGHGNSLGGVVLDSGKFDYSRFPTITAPSPAYHNLRFYDTFGHYGFLMKVRSETVRDTGCCLAPMNAFLLLQGLETLSLRMQRHVANAQKVAEYLKGHPQVAWVAYAGLPNHASNELARKYLPQGTGAVLSFGIKDKNGEGVRQAGKRFIEGLQLFSHLANIGDVRSLVIHPASTTHQQLTDAELEACGVGADMLRLSVGIENEEDLLWDLSQAFHAL